MRYCNVGEARWDGRVRTCGQEFDYRDGKLPEMYQCESCQIKTLKAQVERLEATLENRALGGDSPLLAADAYYEIAAILAPNGGSVVEAVEMLKAGKRCR